MTAYRADRKWLLVGAIIYGVMLLNAFRFVKELPAWVLVLGVLINGLMCFGFFKLYALSKPK